jgi:hypothetical protein
MRFTLFIFLIFSQNYLFSQILQGFSGSESLGSAQNVINLHSAGNLLLQPAVPLKNLGYYTCFSSVVPAISASLSDYQLILVKQNKLNSYRIGLVQANEAQLKKQIFVLGISKKILPEFFMGIDLIYFHSGIPEYESGNLPGSQFSFFYKINTNIQVASNLGLMKSLNPNENLANYYRLNFSCLLAPKLKFLMMSKKEPDANSADQSFSFQFQKPESSFYINSGSFINRPEFCFGLGFKYNQLDFNFSNSYRKYWGLRFACSIQYFIGVQ